MKKQAILDGTKFQILGSYGMGNDYVYQFEKDESDSKHTFDRIIQYYTLGEKLTFWETHIIEKITDKYLTISKIIMNEVVKVRIKLEDITPYEGDLLTIQEQAKQDNEEVVK